MADTKFDTLRKANYLKDSQRKRAKMHKILRNISNGLMHMTSQNTMKASSRSIGFLRAPELNASASIDYYYYYFKDADNFGLNTLH